MNLTKTIALHRVELSSRSWSWIFLPLFIALLVFMLAYPVGLLFLKSFAVNRPGQPTAWGLEGWIAAFSDGGLPVALANTFSLGAVRVAITSFLAIFKNEPSISAREAAASGRRL